MDGGHTLTALPQQKQTPIFVLADPQLRPGPGHPPRMALALSQIDPDLRILANQGYDLAGRLVYRVFHQSYASPANSMLPVHKNPVNVLRNVGRLLRLNWRFWREMRCGLQSLNVPPAQKMCVICPNVDPRSILGLLLVAIEFRRRACLLAYLLKSHRFFRAVGPLMKAGRIRNLRFATESQMISRQIESDCALRSTPLTFPMPTGSKPHDVECVRQSDSGAPVVCCGVLGPPSLAKGFDTVVSVVKAYLKAAPPKPALRFLIQIAPIWEGEALSLLVAELVDLAKSTTDLRLLGESLDDDAYDRQLRSCDLVLLPYHTSKYARQSSGVVVEAAQLGIPIVVTGGTVPAELARSIGVSIEISEQDPSGTLAALFQCASQIEELRRRSRVAAHAYRESTAQQFLDGALAIFQPQ